MAYRFVSSYHDLGPRRGPILGFTIHMAEGGNTVNFLHKQNPNGVSVHYVIEYDGEIVQMLREDHMHSSIRIRNRDGSSALRRDDEAQYNFRGEWITYGATAAKAVLGPWAYVTSTLGPNHATLAVEIEGFAADGPNTNQNAALERLVRDIRSRYPEIGLLGHRDHNVKGCPGKRIDWAALGGHGKAGESGDTSMLDFYPVAGGDGTVTLAEGRGLVNVVTEKAVSTTDTVKTSHCRVHLAVPYRDGEGWQDGYLVRHKQQAHIAFDAVVASFIPAQAPAPDPAPAVYDVIVGGKPVGSVTLP